MEQIRPETVCTPRVKANALFVFLAQPLLAAVAERCVSFSFCAHSSQHTSTVLPPILTLMGFASNLQSQAAQVFSTMTFLHARSPGRISRPCRKRVPLSESLAISIGQGLASQHR